MRGSVSDFANEQFHQDSVRPQPEAENNAYPQKMSSTTIKPPLYAVESQGPYTVCVTGAAGYLGANVVARLLAAGHTVHGTVRDVASAEELFKHIPGADKRLKFFKTNLTQADGWVEAMQGCIYVLHTASPFIATPGYGEKARKVVVEPAVKGTEYVLGAVNQVPSVKRVVLTSSQAALAHSWQDKEIGYVHNEADWNEKSNLNNQPYHYSKTLAEKRAWEIVKEQSRWDLVVINPPMILGPPAVNRADGESVKQIFMGILRGQYVVCPEMGFPLADVRDVAASHMVAAFTPAANGRYIVCQDKPTTLWELADTVGELYPKHVSKPKLKAPSWLVVLMAPLIGAPRDIIRAVIGGTLYASNAKAVKDLGLSFIDAKECLKDMGDACEAFGIIKIKK